MPRTASAAAALAVATSSILAQFAAAVPPPLSGPVKQVYIDYRDINATDLPAVITMAVDLASHAFSQPSYTVIEAVNAGYNVVAICFLLVTGPADFAADWAAAGPAAQQAAVAYAHSMGAMVIVAAGGVTDVPYNMDATAYGKYVAQWVKDNNLDGIDFDLEGLGSGFTAGPIVGQALVDWMITSTLAARTALGPAMHISHAPPAPYFGIVGTDPSPNNSVNTWPGDSGGYSAVYAGINASIDWVAVQMYNQGASCYTSFDSLFLESNINGACPQFPGTSISELVAYGVTLDKIVIGKITETYDGGNGYVAPATLAQFFAAAKQQLGWDVGVAAYCWSLRDSAKWIAGIYPPALPSQPPPTLRGVTAAR